MTFFSET